MRILTILAVLVLGVQDAPRKRGFLGTSLMEDGAYLKVGRVVPGSPAERAGLMVDDLIVKLDDEKVTTVAAFTKGMQDRGAGVEIRLSVKRRDETLEIKITLGIHPQDELEEADKAPGLRAVRKEFNIAYDKGERQKLNLVLPDMPKAFPVVMWIHAGAWSFGGRENETALGVRLAERGIGFAAISHRLTGGGWWDPKLPKEGVRHPAHIEDCARAFAWLHENIKSRGGDPTQIFVAGHSSGGQLAALLAMDPRYLKAHNLPITAIRGSIPIGGAYDLTKYHSHLIEGLGKEKADAHLESIFGAPADWVTASPVTYVKDAKVQMLVITEDVPGFQLYKADFETAVPKGSPITFWTAADRVHENITSMMSRKEPDAPRDRMIEFIKAQSAP